MRHTPPLTLFLASLLTLAACADPPAALPTDQRVASPGSAPPPNAAPPNAAPHVAAGPEAGHDHALEPGETLQEAIGAVTITTTPDKTVVSVDAQSVLAVPAEGRMDASRLSERQRAAWAPVTLPIYAPGADTPRARGLLDHGVATGEALWFAFSSRFDAGTLYIGGTRIRTVLPGYEGHTPPSREAPRFFINELAPELSWDAHGVSYSLTFECDRPGEDARCADDAYVRSLLADLRLVTPAGGKP